MVNLAWAIKCLRYKVFIRFAMAKRQNGTTGEVSVGMVMRPTAYHNNIYLWILRKWTKSFFLSLCTGARRNGAVFVLVPPATPRPPHSSGQRDCFWLCLSVAATKNQTWKTEILFTLLTRIVVIIWIRLGRIIVVDRCKKVGGAGSS